MVWLQYCRPFLWPILCLFSIFAQGFDNVEKWCICFKLCLWHCCLFPSTCGSLVVLLQYCCSFLWPILCPFSIFAQVFDNVEKWCGCFLLFLALLLLSMCLWFGSSIVVLFFGLYFVFFQFFRKVSTMSKSGVVVSFCFWHSCLVPSS